NVGSDADAGFFDSLVGFRHADLFGYQIDAENDALDTTEQLEQRGARYVGYGDGTSGCCGPVIAPNTPTGIDKGVWMRSALGRVNTVSYGWSVSEPDFIDFPGANYDPMKMLIDAGADGIIPMDFGDVAETNFLSLLLHASSLGDPTKLPSLFPDTAN